MFRKAAAEQSRVEEVKAGSQDDSSSPSHQGIDKSAAERERQRLREQERRRREAVSLCFLSVLFQFEFTQGCLSY